MTEICIGTSWNYLGGLFRKSKVDEDAPPAADLSYPAGSAPACREVSLVLNLATNADGEEDPQPISTTPRLARALPWMSRRRRAALF